MSLRSVISEPPCRPLPPNPAARASALAGENPTNAVVRASASEIRKAAAGVEIVSEFDACDGVYFVLSGWMVLKRILEDGRQQLLDFALPGAFIGDPTGRNTGIGYAVAAVTDVEYARIPYRRLPDLLRTSPVLNVALLDAAYDALNGAYDSLTDIGRRTAQEAVASFFYRMERRIRKAVGSRADGSVDFPLTQCMIADSLGLTPEHVCRMLRSLKSDGIIALGRSDLRVLDRERLADRAGLIPEFEDDFEGLDDYGRLKIAV